MTYTDRLCRLALAAVWAACCAALTVSCAGDTLISETSAGNGDGKHIVFNIHPPVSADIEVGSRAIASPEETDIYTMRVFVFSEDGIAIPDDVFKYFDRDFSSVFFGADNIGDDGNVRAGAKTYDPSHGLALPVISENVYYSVTKKRVSDGEDSYIEQTVKVYGSTQPEGYTGTVSDTDETNYYLLSTDNLKNCQIWVVANMGRWEGSEVNHVNDNRSDLEHVETLDDLKHFYGIRASFGHEGEKLNRSRFLPMIGTLPGSGNEVFIDATADKNKPGTFDLTQARSYSETKTIYLDQIVTKIRFRIEPSHYYDESTGEKKWYEFYFDSWTVKNMSRYIYLAPHERDIYDNIKGADAATGNDPEADHRESFIKLMNSRLGTTGSVDDLSMMFYPHAVAAKTTDEENALLHNGEGDGSKEGQDWIAVDGDMNYKIDGEKEGCSPISSQVAENAFIEKDEDNGVCYYYFYTYGNRRGNAQGAPNTANLGGTSYGEGYTSDTNLDNLSPARKKTLCAPENASFLVIKGMVRERTSATEVSVRSVIYTIALGANMVDDYNLKRNTCYTYNIKINGMTENDIEVTVDEKLNPSYNSAVHQRVSLDVQAPHASEFDAHADMRYIQFMAGSGDVEIQLYNSYGDATSATRNADNIIVGKMGTNEITAYNDASNQSTWLKLIDASCSDADGKGDYIPVSNVDGKEYRTGFDKESSGEPVVTEESFWFNGINDPIVAGRYEPGKPNTLFAYADEITSLDGLQTDDETKLKYRSAWLMIKNHYKGTPSAVLEVLKKNPGTQMFVGDEDDTDGKVELYQLIELRQYAPLVDTITVNNTEKILWIERFEEYGMHLDPRRTGDYSTDGLQWGWDIHLGSASMTAGSNGNTSTATYDFSQYRPCYYMPSDAVKDPKHDFSSATNVEYDGLSNTLLIVSEASKSLSCSNHNYYNSGYTTQPKNARYKDFAARYCYYKTSRQEDGTVSSSTSYAWYLPSIDEMKEIVAKFSGVGDDYATLALQELARQDGNFKPYGGNSSQVDADDYDDQDSWLKVVLGEGLRGKQYWSSSVPTSDGASQLASTYGRSVSNWPKDNIASYLSYVYTNYARTCFNSDDVVNQKNFKAPSTAIYKDLYIVDKKELLYYGRIYAGYYNGKWYMYKTTDSETDTQYGVYFTKYPDRSEHYHVRAVREAP